MLIKLAIQAYGHVGPLAQSVEQRTFNPWVVGSSPTGPTLRIGMQSRSGFMTAQLRGWTYSKFLL